MDKLSINLYEDKTTYAPRETVRGAIRWSLQTNPEHLKFSLIWYTSGKGTRDVGVVETVTFDNPGSVGSKDFAFPLPDGPYSFSGKLISLIWAIELTCTPGSQTVRQEIVVSPTGSEVLLGEASAQSRHPWNEDNRRCSPLERILGTHR
jgi:hypothetical protein